MKMRSVVVGLFAVGVTTFATGAAACTLGTTYCALTSSSGSCMYYKTCTKGVGADLGADKLTGGAGVYTFNLTAKAAGNSSSFDPNAISAAFICQNGGSSGNKPPGQNIALWTGPLPVPIEFTVTGVHTESTNTTAFSDPISIPAPDLGNQAFKFVCPNTKNYMITDVVFCSGTFNFELLKDGSPVPDKNKSAFCSTNCQALQLNPATGLFAEQPYTCVNQ
jgi:hypothetical protein